MFIYCLNNVSFLAAENANFADLRRYKKISVNQQNQRYQRLKKNQGNNT
jgi:hypothetical protein